MYKKIKTFNANDDKVVSSMIWGSQYDAMMNWMAKTGNEIGKANSKKTNTDPNMVTGSSTNDVINNIYDLYGCHTEWTLEVCANSLRVLRGGNYNFSNSPASRDNNYPYDTSSVYSSRAALYIK